jgi:hypothetical protein
MHITHKTFYHNYNAIALNKNVDGDGNDDGNGIEQYSAPGN